MLGWCSLAAERISRRKRSSTPRRLIRSAADDLEHLQPAHQRVLGEVDDAHAAAAQLAEDLVVGVVGQGRRQAVGPRPGVMRSPGGAPGRELGDAPAAVGATFQVRDDRPRRFLVEPAQSVVVQGLVGRVQGRLGVHRVGLRVKSELGPVPRYRHRDSGKATRSE